MVIINISRQTDILHHEAITRLFMVGSHSFLLVLIVPQKKNLNQKKANDTLVERPGGPAHAGSGSKGIFIFLRLATYFDDVKAMFCCQMERTYRLHLIKEGLGLLGVGIVIKWVALRTLLVAVIVPVSLVWKRGPGWECLMDEGWRRLPGMF